MLLVSNGHWKFMNHPSHSRKSTDGDGLCHRCTGMPDWAISRELGYPRIFLATDFYSGRFANFWATRNYGERILGEQEILSSFVSLFV